MKKNTKIQDFQVELGFFKFCDKALEDIGGR
jgi:hypothetical protein